jgi:ankyrin repeat protein
MSVILQMVFVLVAVPLPVPGQGSPAKVIDVRDADGRTALMVACLGDDEVAVKSLLARGADPNLRDTRGDTPLLLAADHSFPIVRALVEGGARVDLANEDGRTPLMSAAQYSLEAVRFLLERGADASHRDHDGLSALTIARAAAKPDIEAALREAGAQESLEELLHQALRKGDDEAVRRLIREGADVNARETDSYETPLMVALQNRRLDSLVALLEAGADPTAEATGIENWGDNAILVAARLRSPWALRQLIQKRARQKDIEGALLEGCADDAVLRVLLDAKARIDAKGPNGETVLMCAAAAGAAPSVSLLLQAGADPRLTSADGRTAAKWAEGSGHPEIAALLEAAQDRH